MASNMYMKLGDIEGECNVKGYEKTIEVLNFYYSCFQPVTEARSGAIHASGKANHGTFNFTKVTDIATADILAAMWAEKTIAEAKLSAVIHNGAAVVEYLTITLSNVVISNYSLHGGGNSVASEEILLSFSKIKVAYKDQGEDGGTRGTKAAEWDLATEQKGS